MSKFFWGAATSSHQVEGGNNNDWSEWERAHNLEMSGVACDHYNRYKEDFDIVKSLGHNAHRLSIEWSRIEPEEGKFNDAEIQHYRDVISALRERGIEPFVTLWHWTIPLWFRVQGGWLNKKSPEHFARYVEKIVSAFSNVKFWITLNEPNVCTGHGYFKGEWPPGERSIIKLIRANYNLARAHRLAFESIKKINSSAQIGIAQNLIYFSRPLGIFKKYFYNEWFLNQIKNYQDFVGVNYYFSDRVAKTHSDMKWGIDPEGLYFVLKQVSSYQKQIYILENGIANSPDDKRAEFIRDHVAMTQKAMAEGVDVRGYFYWSLLDNFEWAHGFAPRFGLVEINYKTMERHIRPSAWEYKKIIEK